MKITNWRKYPICVLGYDITRWEEGHGLSLYKPEYKKKWLWWTSKPDIGPTHLQYHSKWGMLLTWPLCFHIWYQFRSQRPNAPGSEVVAYFRIGWARWDAMDECYMVPTAYLGLHWD